MNLLKKLEPVCVPVKEVCQSSSVPLFTLGCFLKVDFKLQLSKSFLFVERRNLTVASKVSRILSSIRTFLTPVGTIVNLLRWLVTGRSSAKVLVRVIDVLGTSEYAQPEVPKFDDRIV